MPHFREAIVGYIRANAIPADKFSHQPRLYRLAVRLAEGAAFDDDVLFGAAWLHDIGVFVGHRPEDREALADWDMLAYAARVVPGLLERFGFPREKIPAVMEVIETHQPAGEPASFEGLLLRDADILEQLGATGVLRNVSKIGRDTRFDRQGQVLDVLRQNLESLPGQLRLDCARKLARDRIALLKAFLDSAESESEGVPW